MNSMRYTPESELSGRIHRIQSLMTGTDLEGLLVIHHTNLFYFSGTSQNGYLFIPAEGDPLLMARRSYDRARRESGLGAVIPLGSLKQIPSMIRTHLGRDCAKIGLELDVIPVNTFTFLRDRLLRTSDLVDASALFKKARLIKSEYEIDLLRQSCSILDQAFGIVPARLKAGMTEVALAAEFEGQMRKNGYGGICKVRAFNRDFCLGNIVSGCSGAVPSFFDGPVNGPGLTPANNPHGAGWKAIEENESVYVDYTCVVNGYTADAERIFALGKLEKRLEKAHQTALDIQAAAMEMIVPGCSWARVWEQAHAMAQAAGLIDHFMGLGKEQVRFLGHGVGLELDEMPVFAAGFDAQMQVGMTFALEPKFVFEQGVVGIENTFALTEAGLEKLTRYDEQIQYV